MRPRGKVGERGIAHTLALLPLFRSSPRGYRTETFLLISSISISVVIRYLAEIIFQALTIIVLSNLGILAKT